MELAPVSKRVDELAEVKYDVTAAVMLDMTARARYWQEFLQGWRRRSSQQSSSEFRGSVRTRRQRLLKASKKGAGPNDNHPRLMKSIMGESSVLKTLAKAKPLMSEKTRGATDATPANTAV